MITLTMGMQRRIHDAGEKWDQLYNDTTVDYSFQLEAWWSQLRERVGARIGAKVTSNVIEGNFPQYDATTELPSIEVGRGN